VNDSVEKVYTYFVNSIQLGDNSVPYSFAAGIDNNIYQPLGEKEALINSWAASRLKAEPGDTIMLHYFIPGANSELGEDSSSFVIQDIVPIAGFAADATLMPEFSGLSDSRNCAEWDPGIPIDLDKIKDQDEQYWDDYGGTPKVFVNLETARDIWNNRFGTLTAVRWPDDLFTTESISKLFTEDINPAEAGFNFQPVKMQALSAAVSGVDFGGLFVGLSFFVILSALILTGLQFSLGIQYRKTETAQLVAIGLKNKFIYRIRLIEGSFLAAAGCVLGTALSIPYARLIIYALEKIWHDAVGISGITITVEPAIIITGFLISFLTAIFTIIITLRKQLTKHKHGHNLRNKVFDPKTVRIKIMLACFFMFVITIPTLIFHSELGSNEIAVFFLVGTAMLIGFLYLINQLFIMVRLSTNLPASIFKLAVRNLVSRRGRSLGSIILVSAGIFIVVSVGSNRLDALRGSRLNSSGTGGFEFWIETTLPFTGNQQAERVNKSVLPEFFTENSTHLVDFRLRDGEDASCLNITRPSAYYQQY